VRTLSSLFAGSATLVMLWFGAHGGMGSAARRVLPAGAVASPDPAATRAIEPDSEDTTNRPAAADPLVPPIVLENAAIDPDHRLTVAPFTQYIAPSLDLLAADDEFAHDERAAFHPHGKKFCSSGCAVSNHPSLTLTEPLFQSLLTEYAYDPMDERSFALESLVYYGRQTRRLIERDGTGPPDLDRAAVLRRELARTHVRLAIRVLDERGAVRAELPPTRVPLDRRHVYEMDVYDVQPLVTSGTVKRVGLKHLWIRL
jgi:hypothetical protein